MKLWDAIRSVSSDPAVVVGLVHVDQVARKVKLRLSVVDQPSGKEIIVVGEPELNMSGNQSVAVALDTTEIEVDLDELRKSLAAQPAPPQGEPDEYKFACATFGSSAVGTREEWSKMVAAGYSFGEQGWLLIPFDDDNRRV